MAGSSAASGSSRDMGGSIWARTMASATALGMAWEAGGRVVMFAITDISLFSISVTFAL